MTATSMVEESSQIASLTPEAKEILHQSILHYLHRSGFSKTLKRFQSEAQIQSDSWKSCSANLEEIYCKHVNGCHQAKDDTECTKTDGKDEQITKSKKKKDKKSSAVEDQSRSTMNNDEKPQDNVVVEESDVKPKKKKKNKEEKSEDTVNELEANDTKKKTKDKKRKSNQEDKPATNDTENGDIHPDVSKEENKSSKKRKRMVSDENEHKTEAPKEDVVVDESEKLEKNEGEKSQKSVKKQRLGPTEPKTINAFQRVKIDQVEFAHEKLQDNSYWAKDGADIGYGAKAQEVLGLVRGKGFRHEKTKKKRGSYRGGQIDLQSHSIKFDYSDQE